MTTKKQIITGFLLLILYILSGYGGIYLSSLPPGYLALFWLPTGVGLLIFLYTKRLAPFFVLCGSFILNFHLFFRCSTTKNILVILTTSIIISILNTLLAWIASKAAFKMDNEESVYNRNSGIKIFLFVCIIPSAALSWLIVLTPYMTGFNSFNAVQSLHVIKEIAAITTSNILGLFLLTPVFFIKYSPKFKRSIQPSSIIIIALSPMIILFLSFFVYEPLIYFLIPMMIITASYMGTFGVMLQTILTAILIVIRATFPLKDIQVYSPEYSMISFIIFILVLAVSSYYIAVSVHLFEVNSENLERLIKFRTGDLQKKNSELLILATTDSLTQVSNRRHWEKIAELYLIKALRYQTPLSLMMIDIDHFKKINDTHGHQKGDLVLIEIGAILSLLLRSSDFVGRYGGEEFVVILPETDIHNAAIAAEKIRNAVTQFSSHGSSLPPFTVSIGIAEIHKEDTSLETIIKRADDALYTAKRNGRNRIELESEDSV
jgi:diguanylate cyclase (GGDEF)-like protein